MLPILSETYVAASPHVTFAIFTDLEHAADRVSGIKKLEVLTPGPVGVGVKFRETRIMFGKEATEQMEITAFEPDRGYSVGSETCGCRFTFDFRFEPEGNGTRVTSAFRSEPMTLMAKIMGALTGWMMKGMMKKCLHQDMSDLKAAAEEVAARAASH